jgi:cytochrome c peroxidase
MFFFDAAFSGALLVDSDLGDMGDPGMVSCASCHMGGMMADGRSPGTVSLGANFHSRNAPALVNSSFYRWTNWGGRFSAQWELPLAVAEAGVIMNGNRLQIAHRIFDEYAEEYEAVFGDLEPAIGSDSTRFPDEGKPGISAWDGMEGDDQVIINRVLVNFSKALAAYTRLLVSRDAPFDAWMAGDEDAISMAAQRGALLFINQGRCVNCHSGPFFADDRFHALGVPQEGANVPESDDGRFKDVPPLLASAFNRNGAYSDKQDTGGLAGLTDPMPEETRRAFRTPTLRGVALTAPYMHSGQMATLADVVEFYNLGGGDPEHGPLVPLHLSAEQKSDLVTFLEALTGAAPDADLLEDTSR